jgi:hypothetical protein
VNCDFQIVSGVNSAEVSSYVEAIEKQNNNSGKAK